MKLKCEESLSNFAIKFNLRHYTVGVGGADAVDVMADLPWELKVGRCKFTPGWKHLTQRLLSGTFSA